MENSLNPHLFNLEDEELLLMLLPQHEKVAFAKEAATVRAKQIFNICLERIKNSICPLYKKSPKEFNLVVDAAQIIFSSLLTTDIIPLSMAAPLSVLVARYGISKLCNN